MATVNFLCSGCEWRLSAEDSVTSPLLCENCGHGSGVVAPPSDRPIEACAACGGVELYVQKDFNRATGITMVVIGAVLVPWTWGLSLLVVTIIDWFLYYRLGDVQVCYACRCVHRGYPASEAIKPFDLATHDRHVYGAAPPGAEEAHR